MKILFIVNPSADHGKAIVLWSKIEDVVRQEFPDSVVEFTKKPGDATEIARRAAESGYEVVVSCGGDGTLNEIVNGIIGTGIKLAVLPLGTGSDFGKTIGIREFNSTLASIKRNQPELADAAVVELADGSKRYYLNSFEAGFGADVMTYVNKHKKFGKRSFMIGIVATLIRLRRFTGKIIIDGTNFSDETIEIIVANGKYFGGGMLASPNSNIMDGILDVHVLTPITRLRTILQLKELIDGSYIEKGHSIEHQGKEVELKFSGITIEVDGEVIGKTPAKVRVLKGAVALLTP